MISDNLFEQERLLEEYNDKHLEIIEDYLRDSATDLEIVDFIFANDDLIKELIYKISNDLKMSQKIQDWYVETNLED